MKEIPDKKMHILLVEDDVNLSYLVIKNLNEEGFTTTLASTGTEGLKAIKTQKTDLCILDIMLPEIDGYSLAATLRQLQPGTPFIFLTARNLEPDKLHGFKLGADDYITKPFSFRELLCRIDVALRRSQNNPDFPVIAADNECITIGSLFFDPPKRILAINNNERKLSFREAGLLHILLKNRENYVSREVLLKSIWGNDNYYTARSMDVYVTRVRKLLKDEPGIAIENLYGSGYRIHVSGS